MRRYKRNPDTGDWLFYGGIAVAAYLAYKWVSGGLSAAGAAVSQAYNSTVNAATNAASAITNQNNTAIAAMGSMVNHTVVMPDGTSASIPAASVGTNGQFTYNGNQYSLSLQGNTYYATAVAASAASYTVQLPTGPAQIPVTSVSSGNFTYQGAGYMLITMPDGSMVGLFPSMLDSNNDFIYWNDSVQYNVTSAGGSNFASAVID